MQINPQFLVFSDHFSGSLQGPVSLSAGQLIVLATREVRLPLDCDAYFLFFEPFNTAGFETKIRFIIQREQFDSFPLPDLRRLELPAGNRTIRLVLDALQDVEIPTVFFGANVAYVVAPSARE